MEVFKVDGIYYYIDTSTVHEDIVKHHEKK